MNGMGIMLKTMGIDPDMLANMGKQFGEKMLAIEQQLNRIERKLDMIALGMGVQQSEAPVVEPPRLEQEKAA